MRGWVDWRTKVPNASKQSYALWHLSSGSLAQLGPEARKTGWNEGVVERSWDAHPSKSYVVALASLEICI
jgi:hypothetical protein